MGAGFSLPQYLQNPQLPGGTPDLSKVDEKVKGIISQFKSATGTDMFSLKGAKFMQVLNGLTKGGELFKNSIVPPTQEGFAREMGNQGFPPSISDPVYMYYFKSGGTSAAIADGQSWWDNLFGGGDKKSSTTSSPEAGNAAALLASIQPAAGTTTTPATAVGGATTQPVTPAAPVPGWGSYASNLAGGATNSATSALIAQGNAAAGLPPPVPPVVPPTV
jgi:hypothetical protein